MIVTYKKVTRNLKKSLVRATTKPNASQEEITRFQYFTLFLLAGVPLMFVFGFASFFDGNYKVTLFSTLSAFGLSIGWFVIRRTERGLAIYRVNIVVYLLLIVYVFSIGGEAGSKSLWMYTFPMIAFFLVGRSEGFFWSLVVILVVFFLFYCPVDSLPIYEYHSDYKLRFLASYITVSVVTYWLESLREYYRENLEIKNKALTDEIVEREKAVHEKEEVIVQLQTALDDVKLLSTLLPICSSCKKIRDDKGYWNQIEEYFHTHTGTKFSHSICPDCIIKLYPDHEPE